ncbi:MAG: oligoendopeptidase F, partial [Anaerolineae bacterium]|nr:oligoendopeptidase F [Anaerolineae bacterium]
MVASVKARSEIAEQFKWDTASVFPSDEAWEAALAEVRASLPHLASHAGRLAEGPQRVAHWLGDLEKTMRTLFKVRLYAQCAWSVETTNQAAAAQVSRANALQAEVSAAIAFAEPELLAIGPDNLLAWAESEPALAIYAHYFEALKRREPHVCSPEVEQVLGQLFDPFEAAVHTHTVLADADLTFAPARSSEDEAPIPISQGNLEALLISPDRETRRTAWESYADAHLAVKNTMANCLATGVKQHVFEARTRRYASTLEAALGPNQIPTAVYRNVVEALRRNYPLWHRYWRVLRRALGYEQLHPYDLKAPLSQGSPVIAFEQALNWICDGLAPLGEAYVNTLRRGVLEQRWVDRYPNQGKTSGAYSTGTPGTHPFVLMSYT